MSMPGVWATTWGHVSVRGHAHLNGLHCHLGSWRHLRPRLLKTMSGSVVLPWPGSALMSMAQIATKGYIDACGLCYNLWPCWHLKRAMLLPGSWQSGWPELPHKVMMSSGQGCWLGPQQQPGTELIFMVPISTEPCADAQVLDSHLRPCWCLRVLLLQGP